MPDLTNAVIKDWELHDGDRGTWKSHWQQITNYMLPNRADYITERSPGSKRNQFIFNSAPVSAADEAAAGLHGNLTSPFLLWFYIQSDDDRANLDPAVTAWFDAATLAMYRIFNGPKHNFAAQSYEYYLDLTTIGTSVMFGLESDPNSIFFTTRHLKECCLVENDEDRIDQVSRRFQYTAKQAVQKWAAAAGEKPNKAYADGKENEKFWFHHRVKPRLVRDTQRADARHKAFESVYVSEADKLVIGEGGFDEFPCFAARFAKASGETYGRGPGVLMLPDVKMLNEFTKLVLKAAQKVVDPPLMLPDDGFLLPFKTVPGAFNYYRAGTRPSDRAVPIETKGNIQLGMEMLNALVTQINHGFYLDYLRMPTDPRDPGSSGKGVTATFVNKIDNDGMRLLSPMLARLQGEFLEPLIQRTFAILWRKSVAMRFRQGSPFPPPPPQLSGIPWHAEYVSPIAVAQKASRLDVIGRLMEKQLALKQMDPNTPMILDSEAIMRTTARDLHAPPEALKTPARLKAEAQIAAQMQQQQHDAAVAQQATGAVGNLAAAHAQLRQAA